MSFLEELILRQHEGEDAGGQETGGGVEESSGKGRCTRMDTSKIGVPHFSA